MTNEEARKYILANYFDGDEDTKAFVDGDGEHWVMKFAIEALEKQIPKKPTFEGDGYADDGGLMYDTWICPCCEKDYELDYEEYEFCPNCGQAIKWE